MPKFEKKVTYQYPIEHIYDIIIDVEKYPEFLPWCKALEVLDKEEELLLAKMTVGFKGIKKTYTSKIITKPPSGGGALVQTTSISGIFKSLDSTWQLEAVDENHTMVNFSIDFSFKSLLLEKMIGLLFERACKSMMNAFEKRAKEIYDKRYWLDRK